ncbi:MAG: METTL5 family protein [Candidatus Thorarchaeota archaeon]
MRLKNLEMLLQSIDPMTDLDVRLEQYPTPATIAARVVYAAQVQHGDITGKTVCDLGCGNGILALGAALMGAKMVLGVDVESKALKVSRRNADLLGVEGVTEWILADVSSFEIRQTANTVLSNPPFGVKTRGADLRFLRRALSVAEVTYSFHLSSEKSRRFLTQAIVEMGGRVTHVETLRFPIGHLYEFHQKSIHTIEVDLYRIERSDVIGKR